MTDQHGMTGRISMARCASICEACDARMVQRCVCLAGPNGYVTLCFNHAAQLMLTASMAESAERGPNSQPVL